MANEEENFNLVNTPEVVDESISKDDFKFVQSDKKIHDQKFQTKPTTFLKDSLKRFAKNKSSLVAAGILGVLLLMSLIVPFFSVEGTVHDASNPQSSIPWLQPKLFKAGTGFWDGTRKYEGISVNMGDDLEGLDKEANWWPDTVSFEKGGVVKGTKKFTEEQYVPEAMEFAKGGYVQLCYAGGNDGIGDDVSYVKMETDAINDIDVSYNFYLTNFEVFDKAKLEASNETIKELPEGFTQGEVALEFIFDLNGTHTIELVPYASAHEIGVNSGKVNISEKVREYLQSKSITKTKLKSGFFQLRLKNELNHENTCVLIKSLMLDTDCPDLLVANPFKAYSFEDGNSCMKRNPDEQTNCWTSYQPSIVQTYLARAVLCSFTYDTYEAKLGVGETQDTRVVSILNDEIATGIVNVSYLPGEFNAKENTWTVAPGTFNMEIVKPEESIFAEPIKEENVELDAFASEIQIVYKCKVYKYKFNFGLKKMPIFLLGTDKTGRDMFIYTFVGLRTSLLIGVASTIVCFLFGLFWGSVSGYFGGAVDLAMERFTDIISGVPWIVVMTLVIINMGANFWTFALALCLTGWIGTAATTRTQFYRFRGREYVLASRTLGASHGRLIVKHILPNAMGTIITSAVLMVPSVIFSEATISFLGLAKLAGENGYSSLGVILSNNQGELTNHPYLLIFPAVIIALLMISFNLAGNGLRDAVNPSLKGEGE